MENNMIKVGDTLPAVTLMEYVEVEGNGCSIGPNPVDVAAATAGKTIALFALPGAFTPTCSVKHVPGYVENHDALKEAGVTAYNHNIDTSPEHYANIVTTHTYDDRLRTIRHAQEAGTSVCCGVRGAASPGITTTVGVEPPDPVAGIRPDPLRAGGTTGTGGVVRAGWGRASAGGGSPGADAGAVATGCAAHPASPISPTRGPRIRNGSIIPPVSVAVRPPRRSRPLPRWQRRERP
jgi:hypothetical protein